MKNNFEKIIKKENGHQVKIEIRLYAPSFRYDEEIEYNFSMFQKSKGKRKWIHLPLNPSKPLSKELLEFISEKELYAAKIEFWETIKP